MIGEIVAAHRFMVVVVSCARFSCGGGGGGIAFTLLDKATIDGQEIRSSVITPSKRPTPLPYRGVSFLAPSFLARTGYLAGDDRSNCIH